LVDGEKMSKSLGNYYRLADIEKKGFQPMDLRYLFLTANYRVQMNFTWRSLGSAQKAYDSLKNAIVNIKNNISGRERASLSEEKLEKTEFFKHSFTEAINDDLNIPKALGILWEVVKSNIPSDDKYDLVLLFDEVFGLELNRIEMKSEDLEIPEEITKLIAERTRLRSEKKFEEADRMRREIEGRGYEIEDTPAGVVVKKRVQ